MEATSSTFPAESPCRPLGPCLHGVRLGAGSLQSLNDNSVTEGRAQEGGDQETRQEGQPNLALEATARGECPLLSP